MRRTTNEPLFATTQWVQLDSEKLLPVRKETGTKR